MIQKLQKSSSIYSYLNRRIAPSFIGIFLLFQLTFFSLSKSFSQTPICNTMVPLTTANFSSSNIGLSVTTNGSCIGLSWPCFKDNLINNSAAGCDLRFGLSPTSRNYLQVERNTGNFGANVFVGFDFAVNGIALSIGSLNQIKIETYLGEDLQESKSVDEIIFGISLTVGSRNNVGFTTTKPFNKVRIEVVGINTAYLSVYRAVVMGFCEGPSLPCNTKVQLSSPNYPITVDEQNSGLVSVGLGDQISNIGRVLDADLNNFATINKPTASLGTVVQLSVKKALTPFPQNTFAGFDIKPEGLISVTALSAVTISVLRNGTVKQSFSNTGLGALEAIPSLTNGRTILGFVADSAFDEIRLIVDYGVVNISALSAMNVYGPVVGKYCEGNTLACNTNVYLNDTAYPVTVNAKSTGVLTIGLGNSITNIDRMLDADTNNFATIAKPVASVGTKVNLSVKKLLNPYPQNTFAGFDLQPSGLLGINVLEGLTIELLRNGVSKQSKSGSSLVTLDVLSGLVSGRSVIGFVADSIFDEVRLTVDYGLASVNALSNINVYGVIVTNYCPGGVVLCNTPTRLTKPYHPLYIDSKHTGIDGFASAGTVSNTEHAIDNFDSTVATIAQPLNIASTASFAIGSVLDTFTKNTYAGIRISTNSLISATVLNYYTIQLLRNGVVVQTATGGSSLLSINTSLFNGNNMQTVGIISDTSFDEVKLSIAKPISVDLGIINIHGLVVERLCPSALSCYESSLLQYGAHPVVINNSKTGILGTANVVASVVDAENVLHSDNTQYAKMTTVASVLSSASISVANPVQTYPIGTFAGFVIKNDNGLINADILSSIIIKTYKNGVFQEQRSAGSLVDLTLLLTLLGPGNDTKNIGFVATKPFDELQITMGELVSISGSIRVYAAFVDTRTSVGGGLNCRYAYPDMTVTATYKLVTGSLATNDNSPIGTTYGVPSAAPSNPSASSLNVAADGSYSFLPTMPGIYEFDVPVCLPNQTSGCLFERMTITVVHPSSYSNYPVVNTDKVVMLSSNTGLDQIAINVLANDAAGNYGGVLSMPTVILTGVGAPTNGTVSVSSNGQIVYQPNVGFFGKDYINYTVCEQPSNLCKSSTITVDVVASGGPNSTFASDVYFETYADKTLSVSALNGVLANAIDPEGNSVSVIAKVETKSNMGTLTLASNGSFSFAPAPGFVGAVTFEYTVQDNGVPSATAKGTLSILVKDELVKLIADVAVSTIGTTVIGNLASNDIAPMGLVYGVAIADVANPTNAVPNINSDGTFSFASAIPGRYKFQVPGCLPDQISNCTLSELSINIVQSTSDQNMPVINAEYVITRGAPATTNSIVINVKANDGPGNLNGVLGQPSVTNTGSGAPSHGTVSINSDGNVVYTPVAGFFGKDQFAYTLCEMPSGLCATTTIAVSVVSEQSINYVFVSDDYINIIQGQTLNVPAITGVLANDGNVNHTSMFVNPFTQSLTGVGTLTMDSDGGYQFVPEPTYSGPASFEYIVLDSSLPQEMAKGTLHFNIVAYPDLTPTITLVDQHFSENQEQSAVISVQEIKGVATALGTITIAINAPVGYKLLPYDDQLAVATTSGSSTISVDNSQFVVLQSGEEHILLAAKPTFQLAANATFNLSVKVKHGSATNGDAVMTVNIFPDTKGQYDVNTSNNVAYKILQKL